MPCPMPFDRHVGERSIFRRAQVRGVQALHFQQQSQTLADPFRDRHAFSAPAAGCIAMQASGAAEVGNLPAEGVQVGIEVLQGIGVLRHGVILGYVFPFVCCIYQ